MLTAFHVKRDIPERRIQKLRLFCQKEPIEEQIITNGSLVVKSVVCTQQKKNPPVGRAIKALSPAPVVLCEKEDWIFPKNSPFARFSGRELMAPLSINAGVAVLSRSCLPPKEVRVGLYDPQARWMPALRRLLFLSSNLTVLTEDVELYEFECRRLMEEYGASVRVGDSCGMLSRCGVVLAPGRINRALPLQGDALVFTGAPPGACVSAMVYDDYLLKLPRELLEMKPDFLSDTYFAKAVYSLCRRKSLRHLTPYAARCGEREETIGIISEKARFSRCLHA